MKKVARLRLVADDSSSAGASEQIGVRTTGRIKKPKAVFDPSDNYLPRSQRLAHTAAIQQQQVHSGATNVPLDRKRESELPQKEKRLSQSSGQSSCTTASASLSALPTDVCYVCHKRETKRGLGAKNKFITCIECNLKVHKMCLKMEFEDFDILRSNYKCDNCRSCVLCSAFSDIDAGAAENELITCTKCLKSYHLTCHIPNVRKYQQHTNWKCNKCSLPLVGNGNLLIKQAIREIIGDEPMYNNQITVEKPSDNVNIAAAAEEAKNSAAKRTYQAAKDTMKETENGVGVNNDNKIDQKKLKHDDVSSSSASSTSHFCPNEPLEIPDVKCWTVDQVTEFFTKYFPNEAYVFREHEIDGMSLLLLKRSDVIKKLPIKLGPSLRIYSLILKIQTQLNDPTLGWNCGI